MLFVDKCWNVLILKKNCYDIGINIVKKIMNFVCVFFCCFVIFYGVVGLFDSFWNSEKKIRCILVFNFVILN